MTSFIHPANLKKLKPIDGVMIKDSGVAVVYSNEEWVYKRSIPFLIENELWCLDRMSRAGYAPYSERYDDYTIRMDNLGKSEAITDKGKFHFHCKEMYIALLEWGIRHGDITKYSVIIKDNWPFLIDFAESRLVSDPRPDKRPGGDLHWINKLIDELCYDKKSNN